MAVFDEPAARWGKTAAASMPPEGAPYQQKETALPYNPEAYESQVNDMHPAAQYTYQRAVAQGADPQAAYQAAQEKHIRKLLAAGLRVQAISLEPTAIKSDAFEYAANYGSAALKGRLDNPDTLVEWLAARANVKFATSGGVGWYASRR